MRCLIREATIADSRQIVKLAEEFYSENPHLGHLGFDGNQLENILLADILAPDTYIPILVSDGEIVGIMWTKITKEIWAENFNATIMFLYVKPKFRDLFKAVKLYKSTKFWIDHLPIKVYAIHTNIATFYDCPAKALYEKLGFVSVGNTMVTYEL